MDPLRTAVLLNLRKFPKQFFIKYQNKICSKQISTNILPNKANYKRNSPSHLLTSINKSNINVCSFNKYKSTDSYEKNYENENNENSNNDQNLDETVKNKTAKILPMVLHQVSGKTDNSVAVPYYDKEIPHWTETDSVSEATKTMEQFTDEFLKSQQLLDLKENEKQDENIDKYENLDEVESDVEPYPNKNNQFIDIIGKNKYDVQTIGNVISFRLDPQEFSHLPISSLNLKFDMEMPDLEHALKNTKDEGNVIPLGFNAKIHGTVDLDDNRIDGENIADLEVDEISHMVSSLAANICAVALQKVLVEKNKESNAKHNKSDNDDANEEDD